MAYVRPTPADLKTKLPKFEPVGDPIVQLALDEAARSVDETWTEGDFANAQIYLAAHILTMDGHGGGAEAEVFANGMGSFKSMSSGSLSLSRGDKATGDGDAGLYGATSYGQRFWELAMRNQGSPVSTGTAAGWGINPNARDAPNLPGLAARWPGNG